MVAVLSYGDRSIGRSKTVELSGLPEFHRIQRILEKRRATACGVYDNSQRHDSLSAILDSPYAFRRGQNDLEAAGAAFHCHCNRCVRAAERFPC